MNTKQEAISKLNESRGKRYYKRGQIEDVEILAQTQVAKKDSLEFFPYLTVMRVQTEWFIVCHSKLLPKVNDILNYHEGGDWHREQFDQMSAEIIVKGIKTLQAQQGQKGLLRLEEYHLNVYSFLMGWCMAQGVDLVKEGVFDI